MPIVNLTKTPVDNAQPSDKDSYLWDGDLKGFGLKITPAGKKVFLIQYRVGGRTRRVTIGRYGSITTDQARKRAKELLGQVASGVDPASARDQERADRSFRELLEEFVATHVRPKLKKRTAHEYERIFSNYMPKDLLRKPIKQIERNHISRLHHEMRDTPYLANNTLAILSKFFNWCEKHGYRPDGSNPCRHVDKYKTKGRERFLSEKEFVSLGEALEAAEKEGAATPWSVAAIRLLMLTGARLDEILTLRWDYVDFEQQCLRLPDSKTGKKIIYLNPPALSVLAEIPHIDGNPFVICGAIKGAHLVNLQKPWRRIRKNAGLEDVRLHDLRHSFASVAVAGGMSLPLIGKLLGHSQPQTTAKYAHLSDDPVKLASMNVGTKIGNFIRHKSKKSAL